MNRRERIVVLLEYFSDVENGLQDYNLRDDSGVPIRLMGETFNHPSYMILRGLLPELRSAKPSSYRNIGELYLWWRPNPVRRVAYCQGCQRESPAKHIGDLHKHGQKAYTLIPRISKMPSEAIVQDEVDKGVAWLDDKWDGGVFLPDVIREIVGRGAKIAA